MLAPIIMQREELFQCMEQGAQVVTGNLRLSRALQLEYEKRAIAKGGQVWITPVVRQWSVWLNNSWQEEVLAGRLPDHEMLLSAEQQQHVWKSIIAGSEHAILREEATARLADDAWRHLQDWNAERHWEDYLGNIDTRAFYRWCDAFEARCAEQGWLTDTTLHHRLVECYNQSPAASTRETILAGFDELNPLQRQLVEAMQQAGHAVRWVELAREDGTARQVECADQRQEVETFARWTRELLARQPDVSIGLVVPELTPARPLIARILGEVLSPAGQQPGSNQEHQQIWNISLGRPLAQYGIIETAMDVLQLARGECQMEVVGSLLRSAYLAGAARETGSRAQLDRWLRELGNPVVALNSLRYWAGVDEKSWYSPRLASRLAAIEELLRERPAAASAAQWTDTFSRLLNAAGWASDRGLTSSEYQAIEAWHKVLARFSGLDLVTGEMSFAQAVATLRRLVQEKIFQPRSSAAPVQVLGLYEAIGQRFDHLWVMGLHDNAWPASPRPNPFIPLQLQRSLGMPHADQLQELATARLITARLLGSARQVLMSYPVRQGEEHLRPSPLLRGVPVVRPDELDLWQERTWRERVRFSGRLQWIDDGHAPPCEPSRVSGGSGIFRSQSLCPFRAFAEYRLGAMPLQSFQLGLDPMQRGTLLHRVMELFWRDVQDQQTLNTMSDEQLNNRLADVIEAAMAEMAEKNAGTLTRRYRHIESARLQAQVLQWLAIERERAPFSVRALEDSRTVDINGIRVQLKIDRVDQLADGRRLVIDYKTGKVSPARWFGERPEEPQLPLYSVAEDGPVCAVLFGQLKADGMGFSGVVEEAELVPGLPPRQNRMLKDTTEQWPAVLQEWHATIERLAGDFQAGRAEVDPKTASTCATTYCALSALCRISERDDWQGTAMNKDGSHDG